MGIGGSRLGSAVIGSGSLESPISMRDTSTVIIRPHQLGELFTAKLLALIPMTMCATWGLRDCTLVMPTDRS